MYIQASGFILSTGIIEVFDAIVMQDPGALPVAAHCPVNGIWIMAEESKKKLEVTLVNISLTSCNVVCARKGCETTKSSLPRVTDVGEFSDLKVSRKDSVEGARLKNWRRSIKDAGNSWYGQFGFVFVVWRIWFTFGTCAQCIGSKEYNHYAFVPIEGPSLYVYVVFLTDNWADLSCFSSQERHCWTVVRFTVPRNTSCLGVRPLGYIFSRCSCISTNNAQIRRQTNSIPIKIIPIKMYTMKVQRKQLLTMVGASGIITTLINSAACAMSKKTWLFSLLTSCVIPAIIGKIVEIWLWICRTCAKEEISKRYVQTNEHPSIGKFEPSLARSNKSRSCTEDNSDWILHAWLCICVCSGLIAEDVLEIFDDIVWLWIGVPSPEVELMKPCFDAVEWKALLMRLFLCQIWTWLTAATICFEISVRNGSFKSNVSKIFCKMIQGSWCQKFSGYLWCKYTCMNTMLPWPPVFIFFEAAYTSLFFLSISTKIAIESFRQALSQVTATKPPTFARCDEYESTMCTTSGPLFCNNLCQIPSPTTPRDVTGI